MPYDTETKLIICEKWLNGNCKHLKWDDGEEQFFDENNKRHRDNGPALIYAQDVDFEVEYWVHGKRCLDVTNNEELLVKILLE